VGEDSEAINTDVEVGGAVSRLKRMMFQVWG